MGEQEDDEDEQSLRYLIESHPEKASAYTGLAILLNKHQRYDEAEQCFRKAVLLDAELMDYRLNLAGFLASSGQGEDVTEAISILIEVVRKVPTHFGAWIQLGNQLFETGYISAAHTAYLAAATYHPNEPIAHLNLANVLLYMNELDAAQRHYENALEADQTLSEAHQGLAAICQKKCLGDQAEFHRREGFGRKPILTMPYGGRGKPIPLSILATSLEGNIPWRSLVDHTIFQTTVIAVEYLENQSRITPHRLVFNAIGDADLCQQGLEMASRLIEQTDAPVINAPDAVLQTGRQTNAERLRLIPGIMTPRMTLISKQDVISGNAMKQLEREGWTFPLLLRSPGFHAGNFFVRVEDAGRLREISQELPGEKLLAIEFLESGSGDGIFRKCRVMSIDGQLFPTHMAVSKNWKVHYFSSEMDHDLKYRDEEDAFLNDFSSFLQPNALAALGQLSKAMGLEYCGVDFGVDKNGTLILFEANATMAMVPPANEKQWEYRRPSYEKAMMAVREMFVKRAGVNL